MNTQENFRELLDLIESISPDYIEALGKGYSRIEIESSIEIHPIPESLIAIYLCVNGIDENNYNIYDLIPGYNIIPLQKINTEIEIYKKIVANGIKEMGEEKYLEYRSNSLYWTYDMIPFLEDGCGGTICVRTLNDDRSVWEIPKGGQGRKINSNLDRFILTAIECYRQGAYYLELDEDVYIWNINWDLAQEIVKNTDPDIENYFPP